MMTISQFTKLFWTFLFSLVILGCEPGPENPKSSAFLSAKFSSDGKTLYAMKNDGLLVWWDYATKKKLGEYRFGPAPSGDEYLYTAFLLHPDGKRILTTHADGTVFIWDLKTKQQIHQLFPAEPMRHRTPAFSPDGSLLAFARFDAIDHGTISIFDSETGKEIWSMDTFDRENLLPSFFIFPDNTRISIARNVYAINPKIPQNRDDTAPSVHRFNFAKGSFRIIHLSSNKKQFVTVGEIAQKQVVCVCDTDTYATISEQRLPELHYAAELSRDESMMLVQYVRPLDVAPGAERRCMVMDRETQQIKKPIRNYGWPVLLAPDNKNLIVGHENGLGIRDIETDKEIGLLSP